MLSAGSCCAQLDLACSQTRYTWGCRLLYKCTAQGGLAEQAVEIAALSLIGWESAGSSHPYKYAMEGSQRSKGTGQGYPSE